MITLNNKPKPEEILPFTLEQIAEMSAFDLLYNASKMHMDEVAITYSADISVQNPKKVPPKTEITYRKLIDNILCTYSALKKSGVKKGDIVSYASITTPEFIYTAYACVLIGSIFNPVDIRLNSDALLQHFKDEPSKLFFAPKPFANNILPIVDKIGVNKIIWMDFQESLPTIIRVISGIKTKLSKSRFPQNPLFLKWAEFIKLGTCPDSVPHIPFEKDDVISFGHTTGTTGVPKALMHTNENWNAQAYNFAHSGLDIRRGETFFNCTASWVDFGLINGIHGFLCSGIKMMLDPLWTPEKNSDFVLKYKPQWWMGAPGWLDDLFINEKYANSDMQFSRYLITGGAPLYPHKHILYQQRLKDMNSVGKIVPGYGMSEASAALCVDMENKPETIGKMWPLVDAKIINRDTGEELNNGEEGELLIASNSTLLSQIALGYYNNEEETATTFVKDNSGKVWIKSGDKVVKNPDDTYTWLSRYKNVLTYNGYNINCEKIVSSIDKIDDVDKVVVIGCVTADGNQMPIVCVETKTANREELKKTIISYMTKHFPDYYQAKDIVFYDEFPVISMKIDVRKIKSDLLNENGEYINS